MRKRFRPQPRRENKNPHNINRSILAPSVRLVGDNVEVGVYDIKDALVKAEELELDLVEISPKADPPVCKITDYK
ncbi:MAG: translation initiation factor IF-3, partial [Flavobacteriaceae bacterium]|nr:translation initiation factor IF-3 [Flavobacteriaceae bacterium]MDG2414770.1 translation initiation factor IF-3 [Flavobacteriaceae bacterium]